MQFAIRAVRQSVIVLLVSSVLIFFFIRAIPGDPVTVYVGEFASEAQIAAITEQFGLDQPVWIQYGTWISNLVRGDFGTAYVSRVPVLDQIRTALVPTIELAVGALLFALVLGIGTGIVAARRAGTRVDYAIQAANGVAIGVPNFWFGLMLILVVSVNFGILPTGGRVSIWEDPVSGLRTLILPSIALGWRFSAIVSRFLRTAILETMKADHVRTAKAMGVAGNRVLRRYGIRNASIPLITVVGMELGRLLGGAVIIENVFAWPGLGRLALSSIQSRDFVTLQAIFLWFVLMFVVVNILVDLIYMLVDPRVRPGTGGPKKVQR